MTLSNQTQRAEPSVSVTLFRLYYDHGKAPPDKLASSHWNHFAAKIRVKPLGIGYELEGHGFGGSSSGGVISKLYSLIVNALQLTFQARWWGSLIRDVGVAKEVVEQMGLAFSQDAFRQVCTLNLLATHLSSDQIDRILVIGD
jgi:hypothetical protein